ncbi:hypothetical protein PoB_005090700 [Plakobranchus ocellatus]|uniref:Uncharacterized protein n=1 Tax=Plakobranchus ocellatus TaxID=259542 RepID=A0AAV4BYJ9_9GAST|nr:hypothetical protein PoB_005090700 [Plakobranchus ocellatus]
MDLVENCRVQGVGSTGCGAPMEMSQSSADDPMSTSLSMRPVVAVRYEAISSKVTRSLARRSKLMQSSPRGSMVRGLSFLERNASGTQDQPWVAQVGPPTAVFDASTVKLVGASG